MNELDKFRLDEHLLELKDTIESAPEEAMEAYNRLKEHLKVLGMTTPTARTRFMTFWLGVELQSIYSDVLAGQLRTGKYFQIVCSTLESLLKFSFTDTTETAWALSSILKTLTEDSMRCREQVKDAL